MTRRLSVRSIRSVGIPTWTFYLALFCHFSLSSCLLVFESRRWPSFLITRSDCSTECGYLTIRAKRNINLRAVLLLSIVLSISYISRLQPTGPHTSCSPLLLALQSPLAAGIRTPSINQFWNGRCTVVFFLQRGVKRNCGSPAGSPLPEWL